MKVLVISHAYAASYNRHDKLARLGKILGVDQLGVVVPRSWHDRMMDYSRPYEKIADDDLYKIYLLGPIFNGSQLRHWYWPWQLNRVVSEFEPDLIHVELELHDWLSAEIVWLNSWFWKKKLVFFVWENLRRNYSITASMRRRFVARRIDGVIGGNAEAVTISREDGFEGESDVIPQFGVDEVRFKPMDVTQLKQQLGIQDKFCIGFVGRYVEEKGIITLINAVKRLRHNGDIGRHCKLLLLSSMKPPLWLHEQIRDIRDAVLFLDDISHEDFPRYMNLFDVLVLPSETGKDWKEQFGRVMIEAMACGVPVIGSSSGAIPDVVGNHGLVFEEKNAEDLSRQIDVLMKDDVLISRFRSEVRPYVLENFTHDKVVERTVSIWNELTLEG